MSSNCGTSGVRKDGKRYSDSHITVHIHIEIVRKKTETAGYLISRKPKPDQEADSKGFRINTGRKKHQSIMIKAPVDILVYFGS